MTSSALPPQLFDRPLIAKRLTKADRGAAAFIFDLVRTDLEDRLAPITRTFERAAVIGPMVEHLPEVGQSADGAFKFDRFSTLAPADKMLDAEALALPHTDYDLIVSLLDVQAVNDVPGYLINIARHLKPDGLMLTAALGGDSLKELRQAFLQADETLWGGTAPRVAPFLDVRGAGSLLQRAGFALPMADIDQHIVRYGSPLALMRELKALGAANPLTERAARPIGKQHIGFVSQAYEQLAGDEDGRVRATLEIIWLSGWAPHESQQQPLKPGSAKMSLKQALGDKSGN